MELEGDTARFEDRAALVEYLVPVLGSPDHVTIDDIAGGNANESIILEWDDTVYVIRLPAEATLAPDLLADLDRERAALTAVADEPVPAPTVHDHCRDPTVVGREFLLVEFLPGEVLESGLPPGLNSPGARQRLADDVVDTLAAIHAGPVPDAYAADPATPGAALDRQLETFRDQLAWAEERTTDRRRVADLHTLIDRLEANRPDREAGETTFVHGDYKPDNLMVDPGGDGAVVGVLDWEMAGRGDPLTDLGWLLSYWSHPDDPPLITDEVRERYADHDSFPILEVFVDEYGAFTAHPDTPSRGELVDRYEAATERSYQCDPFYRALGAAKLAVICEGFFRSYLAGTGTKDSYPAMELIPFALAEQGHQVLDGERPLRY